MKPLALIFGESEYDSSSLKALLPALPIQQHLDARVVRKPIVLQKNAVSAHRIKMAKLIAIAAAAEEKQRPRVLAIAHRDCDAVEPAHVDSASNLKADLKSCGVKHAVAATPAWEMESWWLLFPEAFAALRPSWAKFDVSNRSVGSIADAKEFLIRELRPKGQHKIKDYREADSPLIAEKIASLNLISGQIIDRCASLRAFVDSLEAELTGPASSPHP